MSAPLVLALLLAVAIPWELVRAYRFREETVDRWARDHDVELTPESRPMVRRYLRRARVLRTWGGVAGAVLPTLIDYVVNGRVQVLGFGTDGESAPLAFGSIFVGYLLGALYAEVSTPRAVASEKRAASLARRELEDYLSRRLLVAQRGLTAVGALGTVAIGLVPYGEEVSNPSLPALVLVAAGVLGFGAGVEALERWMVRRPQPYTSPELLAADDSIRAQSTRAVAGAALALLLLLCSGLALGLQASDVAALHSLMVVPAVACLLASLVAVQDVADSRWSVRRRPARGGTAVSA
jgi:hypothetical protein